MHAYPESFRADLRTPTPFSEGVPSPWLQWRSRALIELAAGEVARFALEAAAGKHRVLEVGCGTGFLALELAREGHAVVGIDPSRDALAIAHRTRGSEALDLRYEPTTYEAFEAPDGSFDAVVFNRSLHHVDDLPGCLAKTARLLAPGGVVACNEFVYDRFDERAARWMVRAGREIEPGSAADARGDEEIAAEAVRAWMDRYQEHHLHGADALLGGLDATFRRASFSWEPYLFVRVVNEAKLDPLALEAAPRRLHEQEKELIAAGRIAGVCFRWVGSRDS